MQTPNRPQLALDQDSQYRGRNVEAMNSPNGDATHSRDSSAASDDYSPTSTIFSQRDHLRFTGSCSSLASTAPSFDQPESPNAVPKTYLHDLVEDPEEIDEEGDLWPDAHRRPSYSRE